jgi:phosphatidylglycerophosphate synthase
LADERHGDVGVMFSGVDGWVARRLEQTSRFGAWLDVVVDNLSRGMLWSMLFEVIPPYNKFQLQL